jgi:hypothetical protein
VPAVCYSETEIQAEGLAWSTNLRKRNVRECIWNGEPCYKWKLKDEADVAVKLWWERINESIQYRDFLRRWKYLTPYVIWRWIFRNRERNRIDSGSYEISIREYRTILLGSVSCLQKCNELNERQNIMECCLLCLVTIS